MAGGNGPAASDRVLMSDPPCIMGVIKNATY